MTELSSVSGLRGVREAQIAMRDACFSDMIALIKICHEAVPAGTDGKEALAALYESAEEKGVEGFGAALSLPPSPQPTNVEFQAGDEVWVRGEISEAIEDGDKDWVEAIFDSATGHIFVSMRPKDVCSSPAGAQGQVQGVQQSEDSSSHPPSKLVGSMATASDDLNVAAQEILKPHWPVVRNMEENEARQKEVERIARILQRREEVRTRTPDWQERPMPSPIQAVAESCAHAEVVEKDTSAAAPSAGSGQEGRPPRTVGCTASADCIHECPANEPEARLDEFKTTVIAMLDPELTGEQKKAYIAARGKELREMAALLPPASKPSAAMNEISLVKLVLSAHQTAYARFHCTEKRGVIESHGMAIGYASVELAKALRGEK